MDRDIQVLQIAGGFRANVDGKSISGGVASFLKNYCILVQDENIHFDFLALRNQCFEAYRDEFESIGGNLYCLNLQSNGFKRVFMLIVRLVTFLQKQPYDVIHINMGSFFPSLCCAIAGRLARVNTIIVHSHSSGVYSRKKRIIANLFKPILIMSATKCCACSLIAAKNLFPQNAIRNKKIILIKNAVDTEKFKYSLEIRNIKRKELGVEKEIVIGHVGRFVEVKNHSFLIDLFQHLKLMMTNVKLVFAGEGELKLSIQEKVRKLGLQNDVIFLGYKKNIHEYLQAMDIFILPSIIEGFPISALEAQASGLPCYISNTISQEVKLCDSCRYLHLSDGAEIWAKEILKDIPNLPKRENTSQIIRQAGYDLKDNIKAFVSLYRGE